jgi:phosphatidylserine decarboxylase
MKLAQGAKSWILLTLIIGVIFGLLSVTYDSYIFGLLFSLFTVIFLLTTILLLIFFRDPDRTPGHGVVACADGKITEIINLIDDDIGKSVRISTFMNLHNVHVNRTPYDGKVLSINHKRGAHIPAFKKESEKNEQVVILLNTRIGKMKIVQIAGTIARRIVPYIKQMDKLKKGDKIGIIRLGSRVDIYLQSKYKINICVSIGDKVKAGVNKIAEITD